MRIDTVLLDVAVILGLSSGILLAVVLAQTERLDPETSVPSQPLAARPSSRT